MGKRVLVTGGSGHLGNFVCSQLIGKGYEVFSFDQTPPPPNSLNQIAGVPFIKGDLLDLGELMRAIAYSKAEYILHLAAITGPSELRDPYSGDMPPQFRAFAASQRMPEDTCFKVNTLGTWYVLDAARRLGVKNVVLSSSYYATGIGQRPDGSGYTPPKLPVEEDDPVDSPMTSYDMSKYFNEIEGAGFSRAYGMNVIALRYMGVFYPDNDFARKMYKFGVDAEARAQDKGLMIGDCGQYVDARDIADIMELCIGKIGKPPLKPFEVFFCSTDTMWKEDSATAVAKRWPQFAEMAKNLIGHEGVMTTRKAEKLLGFKSHYSWRDGKDGYTPPSPPPPPSF
ncbi:MAG: NAD(P)-dependent oxidoreductase [Treponema sp.]|jgi:nucleoside-diphosphate-sugar epimerase|nr:NAD(P)-dependent oxidoreductase [Treponema sp.]